MGWLTYIGEILKKLFQTRNVTENNKDAEIIIRIAKSKGIKT